MNNKDNANKDIITQRIKALLDGAVNFEDYVDFFFQHCRVEELLKKCGGDKKRLKHSYSSLLKHLVKLSFKNRTLWQDMEGGYSNASFSLHTVYRFLDNPKIDWIQFTTNLAFMVFLEVYEPSLGKPVFFVLDDTAFSRDGAKYCEGFSRQKDHNTGKYYKGYRLLTLSLYWNSLALPVSCVLQSTAEDEKILWPTSPKLGTAAERTRAALLKSTSTDALLFLLKYAISVGFPARTVLFDSWFTYPAVVQKIQDLGLEVVGMVKGKGNTKFLRNGKEMTVEEIYEQNKRLAAKDGEILFQIDVNAIVKPNNKPIAVLPVTLNYCRNRHKNREYFRLLSTSAGTPPEDVLDCYEARWSIEQFFKDTKSPNLRLTGATRALSLRMMTAYISVVFIRYLVIFSERSHETMSGDRSIQKQFYKTSDEIQAVETSINYLDGIQKIMEEFIERSPMSERDIRNFFEEGLSKSEGFKKEIARLPKNMFVKKNGGE